MVGGRQGHFHTLPWDSRPGFLRGGSCTKRFLTAQKYGEGGGEGVLSNLLSCISSFESTPKNIYVFVLVPTFFVCFREVKCTEVKIKYIFIKIKTFAEVN